MQTLNEQLDEKVPMNRFRPNIVTDDQGKFPEDEMESFQIQGNARPGIDFLSVSPCARCKVGLLCLLYMDCPSALSGHIPACTSKHLYKRFEQHHVNGID